MFCEQCGKEIRDTAKFCRYCGRKVDPLIPIPESQQINAQRTVHTRTKSDYVIIVYVTVFALIIGMTIVAMIRNYQNDEKAIIGQWVPVSGFHAPSGMPDEINLYEEGTANIESINGSYILDKENGSLNLSVPIMSESFSYKLEDNLLYLNDSDGEVAVYINLSKAQEELLEEYHFAQTVAENSSLEAYLMGEWSGEGYHISFMEEDGGVHTQYNLPVPEYNGSGFNMPQANKMTIGSNNVNAFQFMPASEFTMHVYCYENGSYYTFERESY